MTNPVILYGTQSNGETLPVQVDATGRLVAEGLQGEQGEQGEQGIPGPPGPAGPSFELPPDPYEGALLGWLNGELSWVGTPPIPIPEGVFGPITDWLPNDGLLTVEGDIPGTIGNGVYVHQCDERGELYSPGWDVREVWSQTRVALLGDGWQPGRELENAFMGNGGTGMSAPYNAVIEFNLNGNFSGPAEILVGAARPSKVDNYLLSDGSNSFDEVFPFNLTGQHQKIIYNPNPIAKPADQWGAMIGKIVINGLELVDKTHSKNMRVSNVLGNSLLGNASEGSDFEVGKYLKVLDQRVAPWVLYGNDPTSLIDHLRQIRD